MKIAVIDPSGFTPPYDDQLCNALGSLDNEVKLFTRKLRKNDCFNQKHYSIDEHFYRLSESLSKSNILTKYIKGFEHILNVFTLSSKLKEFAPDIIHFQWCSIPAIDSIYLSSYKKTAPIILTVHDTNAFHGNPTSKLQLFGWGNILKKFDHLIVHTNHSKQQLLNYEVVNDKISVVQHGIIELNKSKHIDSKIIEQKINILFFGNIKEYKGLDILLKAFDLLPVEVKEKSLLTIAGKNSLPRGELERLINNLSINNYINLRLEYIPDEEVDAIIKMANIIVFPYKDIDASGVLMLTLPYGKAIIASRLNAFTEIIRHQENGLLVKPDNVIELSRELEKLVNDGELREKLGAGCLETAKNIPSWENISKRTINIYCNLKNKI